MCVYDKLQKKQNYSAVCMENMKLFLAIFYHGV